MKLTLTDRLLSRVAPGWALQRLSARATLQQIERITGGGPPGYLAGQLNRLTKAWRSGGSWQNGIAPEQIERVRDGAWDLYRNNQHARKIVRTIEAKAVGRGLWPQSQARRPDGKAHLEFRKAAQQLWKRFHDQCDYRGLPGRGGQNFTSLTRTALRKVILSGEVLWTSRRLGRSEQLRRGVHVPLLSQLIDPARLASDPHEMGGRLPETSKFYRGIELDAATDERLAYWLLDTHPDDPDSPQPTARRRPASGIGHLFAAGSEDVDQLRGVSWFAPALLKMRETADYEYDELQAAAVSACVVFKYRKPTGGGQLGVNLPENWDLTDADGNTLTGVQPGMMVNVGADGDLSAEGVQRANSAVESFLGHLLRGQAAAFPGVKGSNLTGDYRGSSFASERSNDNDIWPELEGIQDWLAAEWCQPIYEQVLDTAVALGLLDEVIDPVAYIEQRDSLVEASWQGPVARSIKPSEDALASQLSIQSLISSPQIEAAKAGRDWRQNVDDLDEFLEYLAARKVPDFVVAALFGQKLATEPDEDDAPASSSGPGRGDARTGVSQLLAAS